ncbi:hypothetical protein SVIO_008410 [Streptomyces violaceusniger]|uniref:Uncharacterized protein n=1 Tax=Streptomyces violaceusniger TaxID=68280 RepID=A0A4D4KV19_STRVO|nr:hypothetical protein SVIO_008410 [Streptomyces violaceusniger]
MHRRTSLLAPAAAAARRRSRAWATLPTSLPCAPPWPTRQRSGRPTAWTVFSPQSNQTADAGCIYQLKRELLELKRAVAPLSRPSETLSSQPLPSIDPAIRA